MRNVSIDNDWVKTVSLTDFIAKMKGPSDWPDEQLTEYYNSVVGTPRQLEATTKKASKNAAITTEIQEEVGRLNVLENKLNASDNATIANENAVSGATEPAN